MTALKRACADGIILGKMMQRLYDYWLSEGYTPEEAHSNLQTQVEMLLLDFDPNQAEK